MINPLKISCNTVYTTIAVAIFTIVQTLGHIVSLAFMTAWRNCNVGGYEDFIFGQFLFGPASCGNETIDESLQDQKIITTQFDDLLLVYFVLDALWIVTSTGLLMGGCCRITDKWALIFYLPWAFVNLLVLIFDLFCAIFFSINLPSYGSFLDWLSFVGISNTINSIQDSDEEIPNFVIGVAAMLMIFISARGVIFWVINLILLIVIVRIAVKEYKTKQNETERIVPRRTNAERIKEWNEYYKNVGNSQKHLSTVNYVKQPDKVKMSTLTIISYEIVNSPDAGSSNHASTSTNTKGTLSFNEDFPTIIVTDITTNKIMSPKDETHPVTWSCNNKNDSDLDSDDQLQQIAGLSKAEISRTSPCNDKVVINKISDDSDFEFDDQYEEISINNKKEATLTITDITSDTSMSSKDESSRTSFPYIDKDVMKNISDDSDFESDDQYDKISIGNVKEPIRISTDMSRNRGTLLPGVHLTDIVLDDSDLESGDQYKQININNMETVISSPKTKINRTSRPCNDKDIRAKISYESNSESDDHEEINSNTKEVTNNLNKSKIETKASCYNDKVIIKKSSDDLELEFNDQFREISLSNSKEILSSQKDVTEPKDSVSMA